MTRAHHLLGRLIRSGTLDLETPDGAHHHFGQGSPRVGMRFTGRGSLRRVMANPDLMLGEAYMDGDWRAEPGRLADLLTLLQRNANELAGRMGRWTRLPRLLSQQLNRVRASYRNAARHYDLDEWLFRRFLDAEMYYSCAYYAAPGMDLEAAQRAKAEHIAAKLCLTPGMRVLDIGSGWGSLALHLARHHGVSVTGLTLSARQLEVAQRTAAQRGLADQVQFVLQDYRQHHGRYDRVVSVGMFEHVGRPYYGTFFRQVARSLDRGGVALLHSICRLGPPGVTNPWVRRHIFPGGYNPALSELMDGIEHSALKVTDVELLRHHYALTLGAWQERFQRHRAAIAERLGERFCRMWEFYLAVSQAAFATGGLAVAQVQLAHDHQSVPLTRDYLYQQETARPLRRAG